MIYSDTWFDLLEDYIALVSEHGDAAPLTLRSSSDPAILRLAIQVQRERNRQAERFALADRMWFTSEAAQQASSDILASYHASLYPQDVTVIDAGCGIGNDTITLARRGPVIAVDRDPLRCAMTRQNLRVYGLHDKVLIVCADLTTLRWERADWVFFDPSRRQAGVRKTSPVDWSPALPWIIESVNRTQGAVVKVSPLLDAHTAPAGWTVDCIGWDNACRECLWRYGSCANSTRIQAVSLPSGQTLAGSRPEPAPISRLPIYVYAPQPEVLAAHAIGSLCTLLDGAPMGRSCALLGADRYIDTVFAKAYRVLEECAWRERTVKQLIARQEGGHITVRTYGIRLDTAQASRQLSRPIGRPLTLHVYRSGRSLRAVLTAPIC